MNQNQPPRISEQIYKVQTDRKLIAVYDRLRYVLLDSELRETQTTNYFSVL